MKQKPTVPRNPWVVAAKFRKAGAHAKPEKALRRAAKMELLQECGVIAAQQAFKRTNSGSNPGWQWRPNEKAYAHHGLCLFVESFQGCQAVIGWFQTGVG